MNTEQSPTTVVADDQVLFVTEEGQVRIIAQDSRAEFVIEMAIRNVDVVPMLQGLGEEKLQAITARVVAMMDIYGEVQRVILLAYVMDRPEADLMDSMLWSSLLSVRRLISPIAEKMKSEI